MHATSNVVDIQLSAVFLLRRTLSDRLRFLSAQYPRIGFGVSLTTFEGEHYMLANGRMALPENKADGFPAGEQIAKLDNGQRFQTISVFADIPEGLQDLDFPEGKLIEDVIDLVELIDAPSSLPTGQLNADAGLNTVMNGTEG
ncbi:hypothetical protein SAMN04488030_2684 [Aliiroseovarius halocynthiae]|uniref:hypothetical protein n=1 Tax=Aliiroseovarius halocynthiae TaxID=985055 RepID=UPI00115C77A1|nr:hypothetical protein [Aliiroseovarius halocynthiae]SMR82335.1 hypothetical protein SAMN04488030_2684 [Aliiroseovarius halocynthiae]